MDTNLTSHASLVDFPATPFGHDDGTWYRRERPQDACRPATTGTAIDVSLRELGPMLLIHSDAADFEASDGRPHGDARLSIACGSRDCYMIQVCVSGEVTGICAGRGFKLQAGDIAVIDGARPFSNSARGARTLTLAIERPALARMLDTRLLHGHVLRRNDPLCQLLSHFICALYRVAPQLDAARVDSVVKSAGDMLAACLRPSSAVATGTSQTVAADRVQASAGTRGMLSRFVALHRTARASGVPSAFHPRHLPLPAARCAAAD